MLDKIIGLIEKGKPFFEKVSRNVYLRAIRDGFMAAMPIVLFSSLFMLIAYVPNIFGFVWPPEIETMITKPYNYSMGIMGLLVAGTTAKSLTDSFNRDLPATNQINNISTLIAAIVGFLLLASDPIEGGFARGFLGTSGLLTAFVSAFIVANVYKFFISRDITIKMPEEVPSNVSQVFKDLFPFSAAIFIIYGIDLLVRQFAGVNAAQAIIQLFQPLFSYADGWFGIAFIYGAMAMFWFVGIHGPSIVEPAISAIAFANLEANLQLVQAGQQATNLVTPGAQMFVVTMGGTGATFIVPFMFMLFAKSKQNKAVGRASVVPTSFGVNEPILFGAPIVLNPTFFVPFILAPIVNIWIFKFFVDFLGMNSFSYFLPWITPAPIGLVLGTGFDKLAIVLAVLLIVVDFAIYYPFFRVYDNQILEEEKAKAEEQAREAKLAEAEARLEAVEAQVAEKEIEEVAAQLDEDFKASVLVICAGGGTSGLLANAINKAAKERNLNISAAAGSYGAHRDILPEFDMVILAPQVATNYEDMKKETDALGIKLTSTGGREYVNLTRDPEGALKYVFEAFQEEA